MKSTIKSLPILFVLLLTLAACQEDDELLMDADNYLLGSWALHAQVGDSLIMHRIGELPEDAYGFTLLPDGRFLERKNAGWCGTPPISYATYEGRWQAVEEHLLQMEAGYWGGEMRYRMEVLQAGPAILIYRILEQQTAYSR